MKRLSQKETEAAKRIFNRVNTLSNNYYGKKTIDQARKYVSLNRWIMFPVFNIKSLREGTAFGVPNIYISPLNETIKDNNTGQLNGFIGITYNNKEAMIWLKQTIQKNPSALIKEINNLGKKWDVKIEQKIKTCFKDNTPVYKNINKFDANNVSISDIKNSLLYSDKNLLHPNEGYEDEPVIGCITMFSIEATTSHKCFDVDVKKAFSFFKKALELSH